MLADRHGLASARNLADMTVTLRGIVNRPNHIILPYKEPPMPNDETANLHAFDDLASGYDRFRPSYPNACLDALRRYLDDAGQTSGAVVDVGCGTGIWTRLLRRSFGDTYGVFGVEPSISMLSQAQSYQCDGSPIGYLCGRAEDLPLDNGSAACITVAQAAQWFRRDAFYREAYRVLVPSGVLCIVQNNRRWDRSAFLSEYEDLLEAHNPAYTREYRQIDFAAEVTSTGWFADASCAVHDWVRSMSFPEFIGMSLSSTKVKAISDRIGRVDYEALLRGLLERYSDDGETVQVFYTTESYMFTKD